MNNIVYILDSSVHIVCRKYDDRRYWESQEGIKVGGQLLRDIRFADDQAMVARSVNELQSIMDKLSAKAVEYAMKINAKKTKVMVVSRESGVNVNILVDGQPVEQVKRFKYLGCWLTEDGRNLVALGKSEDRYGKECICRKERVVD